ncbi:hypothetical protein MAPG_10554 [Magnaporthiopsis poae ATCC 64411]|uniref:HNH nuclease domain-containing protein n=1 Tax=Magnaporthiopsis poae (strain ATCC 64411 / 73-15) TaxID=644358 RepID=A0A0C4ECW5_MAGP6|nr:hypothetical protein MAPG_10554 [Magnaporthiopsis poae ATCC 64411]
MAPKRPLTPPRVTDSDRFDSSCFIKIFHPAYRQTVELLRLGAFEPGGGIDFDFALTACGIVTGNTFADGWLAKKSSSGAFERIARPDDGVLRDRAVFYCVGDTPTNKYPVVPTFDHWEFPHDKLPTPWNNLCIEPYSPPATSSLTLTDGKVAARARDVRCQISGHFDAVESAHLVPVGDGNWFIQNDMIRYCQNQVATVSVNDVQNFVVLRRDLHHLLDTRRLFFNAKATSPSDTTSAAACLVVQVTGTYSSADLVAMYHNRALQPSVRGVPVELLFARLAWTLFTDTHMPFFIGRERYTTLLFDSEAKTYMVHENMSGEDVRARASVFPAFKTRSMSPKKRSRGPEEVDDGDTEVEEEEEEEEDEEEEVPRRGRTMMRTCHAQQPVQMSGYKPYLHEPPLKKRHLTSP